MNMHNENRILTVLTLLWAAFFMILPISNAYANADHHFVKFNTEQDHPDVKLAKALLRNIIDFDKAEGFGPKDNPEMYAKRISFGNGKEMLFTRFYSNKTCAFRGCKGYVAVKNGENSNWQLALNGAMLDYYYIDTRKQNTDFPRLTTETEGKFPNIGYWLWSNDRYRLAR